MLGLNWKRYNPDDGQFYDRNGEIVQNKPEVYTREIAMPYVMRDITPYKSPAGDHKLITSRSWRREDLAVHNCTEADPPAKPRGFKNARFARKRGLPLNAEICKDQNAAENHNRELHDASKERRPAFKGRAWRKATA